MKRSAMAALVAGATVGLVGVGVGVALSRKQGRDAARQWLATTEATARKAGDRVAKAAVEQYHTLAPRAAGALQAARERAPQAVETLTGALPLVSANHKREAAEVKA